ncbi:MAG: glycosyltransferase, partial [Myxococcales bacterium]|nr:glycosyltransferase [Myxococcales bacterium]
EQGPLIVWNHRWEHDKGPEELVTIVEALLDRGLVFRLAVCGHQFRRRPPALVAAEPRLRAALGSRLVQWGELPSRSAYLELLMQAQIALSTARHEFFGIAVLEAVHCGARPLVPDALSYPELFPEEYRYATIADAVATLAELIAGWRAGTLALRADRRALSEPWSAPVMLERYRRLFERELAAG